MTTILRENLKNNFVNRLRFYQELRLKYSHDRYVYLGLWGQYNGYLRSLRNLLKVLYQ